MFVSRFSNRRRRSKSRSSNSSLPASILERSNTSFTSRSINRLESKMDPTPTCCSSVRSVSPRNDAELVMAKRGLRISWHKKAMKETR